MWKKINYNYKQQIMKRTLLVLGLFSVLCVDVSAQQPLQKRLLGMDDVIQLALENSVSSKNFGNNYLSSYWSYRSFRANYLPSVRLDGNLFDFNRSLTPIQDYLTGEYSYRSVYNFSNQLTLSVNQNIAATGGSLQLYSQFRRLDQFQPSHRETYYVQPISLSYRQPLWSYNSLKWEKKIEPQRYEMAKRQYMENMVSVTRQATNYFWSLEEARINYRMAQENFEQSKELYRKAQTRFEMGTITKDNLLQLELNVLNDSLSITQAEVNFRSARNRLCSFIGYKEDTEIDLIISYVVPDIVLDFDDVLDKALNNSTFTLDQLIQLLEAESSVKQAEANRGFSASINATFGLSNNNDVFNQVFKNVQDQELVGVSFSIPIADWGLGRGRVKMAQARAEATKLSLEQARQDYEQDLMVQVMQFNNQYAQCQIAKRAQQIADESYRLALENFGNGAMSVTDLNQLQEKKDNARRNYISSVHNYWSYYYQIQGTTLFDYASYTNISAEFDKLVK